MKRFTVLLLFMSSILFGQDSFGQFGLKLGVHSFDLNSPSDLLFPNNATVKYEGAKLGFQIGIFGKIPLGGLFIESRLMLRSTSVEYSLDGENGNAIDQIREESFTQLDIPILVGGRFLFLDVFTGPVAHIFLNSTSDLMELETYTSDFKAADFGWRIGVGTGFSNVVFGLEFETNFSNFGDHISIGGQDYSFGDMPNRLIFNVGFKI